VTNSLWVLFTIVAAMGQTARNAMQRDLTPRLGAAGATQVRFLFGFPFALIFLIGVALWTHAPLPQFSTGFDLWTILGAVTQVGGTALMLLTMERRSFVVTIAYLKTEPVLVALFGFLFLADGRRDRVGDGGRDAVVAQAGQRFAHARLAAGSAGLGGGFAIRAFLHRLSRRDPGPEQ
jgi:drug/metabolite transporter (DMT)-like permease